MSNIQSSEIQVIQIPAKENGFHAICHARIATSTGQIFSALGEAINEKGDDASAKGLLQQAEQDGYERVMSKYKICDSANRHESTVPWNEESHFTFSENCSTKRKTSFDNKGGGSKPITQKQKDTITMLCKKNHIDSKDFIQKKYDKDIHQLQGNDAHNLIQELTNKSQEELWQN